MNIDKISVVNFDVKPTSIFMVETYIINNILPRSHRRLSDSFCDVDLKQLIS